MAVGGWKLSRKSHVDDGGAKVADQFWIDHMPKNDRDFHDAFIVQSKNQRGIKLGVIQHSSAWTGKYSLFKHELAGDQLTMTFPQNGHSATVKVTAKRCSAGAFDLCLDVTNQRGTFHFYSRSEWRIGSLDDARALDAKLLAAAPAAPADFVPSADTVDLAAE